MAGLATACKISALMLLPVLGLAFVWPRRGRPSVSQFLDGVTAFGFALRRRVLRVPHRRAVRLPRAGRVELRLNPQWFADKAYWTEVSSGTIDVPFMIQWAGTPAITFVAAERSSSGRMGPALGLASLVGPALVSLAAGARPRARARSAAGARLGRCSTWPISAASSPSSCATCCRPYFALAMLAAYGLVFATDWLAQTRPLAPERARTVGSRRR